MTPDSVGGRGVKTGGVDEPTRRLGTVAAVVFAAQLLVSGRQYAAGADFEAAAAVAGSAVLIGAGLGLRRGAAWARTVLVVYFTGALALVGLGLLRVQSLDEALAVLAAALVLFIWVVALSLAIERRERALPFPEDWREWAASRQTHILLLAVGLLAAVYP